MNIILNIENNILNMTSKDILRNIIANHQLMTVIIVITGVLITEYLYHKIIESPFKKHDKTKETSA
jgi:hypothetical protein